MYELSLPFGVDLNNQISLDKSSTRVVATSPSLDTSEILDLQKRVSQWQAENWPKSMQKEGASMAIMWSHLSMDSLFSSIEGAFIALFVISIVMIIVLKSLRYGLISLVPNIFACTYWVWIMGTDKW